MRSAWRGDGRKTSAPKRATSKRAAAMDIISMAQQASPKSEGPDGAAACPVHGFVERGEDNAFVFEELAEVVWLGEGDVLAERCAHWASSEVFSHIGWRVTNMHVRSIEVLERGRHRTGIEVR